MEKLFVKKKLAAVKLYLSGLSHQEIATKIGIAVGSVSAIVTELKGGSFPEAADRGRSGGAFKRPVFGHKALRVGSRTMRCWVGSP